MPVGKYGGIVANALECRLKCQESLSLSTAEVIVWHSCVLFNPCAQKAVANC